MTKTELAVRFTQLAKRGLVILTKNFKPNAESTQRDLLLWRLDIDVFLQKEKPAAVAPLLSGLLVKIRNTIISQMKVEPFPRIFLSGNARGELIELCTDITNVKKWSGTALA